MKSLKQFINIHLKQTNKLKKNTFTQQKCWGLQLLTLFILLTYFPVTDSLLHLLVIAFYCILITRWGKKCLKSATKCVQSLFKNMRGMLQISLKL